MATLNDHASRVADMHRMVDGEAGKPVDREDADGQAGHRRLNRGNGANQARGALEWDVRSGSGDVFQTTSDTYDRLYRNYAALFNFAPIGYFTIDRDGVIGDINLTAALMLNAPRSVLIGRTIIDFIHHEDQEGFYYQKLVCQKNEDTNAFELKMKRADGFLFDAQLQMQQLASIYDEGPRYGVTLMDISEHVQLSSSHTMQQRCLEIATTADDMPSLLTAYVQAIKAYLNCDAVGIRLRDADGRIPYQAYDGFSQAFHESESPLSLHTDQCMCIAVIKGSTDPGRFFFTSHGSFYINGTSRFMATLPPEYRGKTRNICNAHGYESVALVPITVDNAVQGLIHAADRRENAFPLRLVENLEAVGARVGLSIHRFHLQNKLSQTVETLDHLSSHLLTAQEDEQRRIAMELHDGCGQDLNVLKLRLRGLRQGLPDDAGDLRRQCDQLLGYTDKIINDIRNLAHGLTPAALDALGLSAAARQVAREFSANTGIQVEADLTRLDRISDPKAQVCLFRILQEALTNIAKHAQASWVAMAADLEGDHLAIRIQDNGIGFDTRVPRESGRGGRGMGLSAMALRCRMINATLAIESEVGKGTRLRISVPWSRQESSP